MRDESRSGRGSRDSRCCLWLSSRSNYQTQTMKIPTIPVLVVAILARLSVTASAIESVQQVQSPDGAISITVRIGDRIQYDLAVNESPVLKNATMSLKVDAAALGRSPQLKSAVPRSYDGIVHPVVRQKASELRDHYNELRLEFEGGYAVVFRAYNEG